MTIPDRLPIARLEDYHTHYLGTTSDGTLFWGYQTFVFSKPYPEISQLENWEQYRSEYVWFIRLTKKERIWLRNTGLQWLPLQVHNNPIENLKK